MSRSAEEAQEVGRENNNERRFDLDLLILAYLTSNEDASHGGQVAHGGRGGRPALELEDAPPSYEDVAHAHSETTDPPSYEAATKSPGYNPPLFNQDIRIPVATATSDPEPTNPPAIEDESADGSRGSFVDRVCDRFSCCCQNCWQYGPVWTCVTLMLCA